MKEEIITKTVVRLVARELDEAVATERVKQAYEKLLEDVDVSEYTDSRIENVLYIAVSKSIKYKPSSDNKPNEQIDGVCIGFNQKQDDAEKLRRNNLKYAEKVFTDNNDYQVAITEGFIEYSFDKEGEQEFVDGKPVVIPIDNREFIDNAGTMKNFNLGKEFKSRFQREAYFIIDGKLRKVVGDIDPAIGVEYQINTNNVNNKVIFTNKGGITNIDSMTATQLWDFVLQFADDFDESVPLNDIEDKKEWDLIITIADVSGKPKTKKGSPFLLLRNDDSLNAVSGFVSFNTDIESYLDDINECNEVIVIGIVKDGYGGYGKSIALCGVIRNPDTDDVASIANKLGGMFIE